MAQRGLLLFLSLLVAAGSNLAADDSQTRYFQELRARRMFSLAERYCLERLATKDLTQAQRADFTLELSRTLTEHAAFVGAEEQIDLWDRAQGVLLQLLQQDPQNPRRPLLDVQAAIIPAARGQVLRWRAELAADDLELKDEALVQVRAGITALEAIEKRLTEYLRTPPKEEIEGAPQSYELREQLGLVRFRLGIARLDEAQLLPKDSAPRTTALAEAEKWLAPLAESALGDDLARTSSMHLAQAARLRGDTAKALQILDAAQQGSLSQAVLDQFVAERMRIQLAKGDAAEAGRIASAYGTQRKPLPGDVEFLHVQARIILRQQATDRKEDRFAAELNNMIRQQVERLRQENELYWAYRCERLLEEAEEVYKLGSELAGMVREARALYLGGKPQESLTRYAEAAAMAVKSNKPEAAFDIQYIRASILLDQRTYTEATTAFLDLTTQFPQNPRVADAHLLAAYARGNLYEERKTKSRREAYTALLEEHRQRFAGGPTAGEAAWMQAVMEEQRLQWTIALKLYGAVPEGHARFLTAQVARARCYEKILDRLRDLQQPTEQWELEAVAALQPLIPTDGERPLTLEEAEIDLRLARILVQLSQPEYAHADRLLTLLFGSVPPPGDESSAKEPTAEAAQQANRWKDLNLAAIKVRIVLLTGQGSTRDAEDLLLPLARHSPAEALPVVDGLSRLVKSAAEGWGRSVGELQLKAAREIDRHRDKLTAEDRQRLDHCLAQAHLALGQTDEAIEIYEAELRQSPDDAKLLAATAERLFACGAAPCLVRARIHWQKLERLRRAGTVSWLEIRYQVARTSFALGEYDLCLKQINAARILYPELGGPDWQAKLTALEKQSQAKLK